MEKLTDRQKINIWLDSIGEFDPVCRAEVLDACAKDRDSREYYVKRADGILSVGSGQKVV